MMAIPWLSSPFSPFGIFHMEIGISAREAGTRAAGSCSSQPLLRITDCSCAGPDVVPYFRRTSRLLWTSMGIRVRPAILWIVAIFLLPLAVHGALYIASDRPRRWSEANWSSTGMLQPAAEYNEARLLVFTA